MVSQENIKMKGKNIKLYTKTIVSICGGLQCLGVSVSPYNVWSYRPKNG